MEPNKITIQQIKERMEGGEQITFLDDRNPQAWGESNFKIPSAIRVPADDVQSHLDQIPRSGMVVTYCT